MELKLEGRLELVNMIGKTSNGRPRGYIQNSPYQSTKVVVNNGADFIGKICIVQFDRTNREGTGYPPAGNVISTNILDDFRPMAYEEYLLYGVWKPYWNQEFIFPTVKEMRNHFGSNDFGQVMFCEKDSTEKDGRVLISRLGSITDVKKSYKRIVEEVSHRKNGRVIIVGSEPAAFSVIRQARRINLRSIRMQPLDEITA